jgi:hypothetical protein
MTTEKAYNPSKTLENDRYFFASYLNMARRNVFIVMSSISVKMKREAIFTDDNLLSAGFLTILQGDKRPDEQQKLLDLLRQHFPFLKVFEDTHLRDFHMRGKDKMEPNDFYNMIFRLLEVLNNLRHEYTHAGHAPSAFPPDLIWCIKETFDAGIRKAEKDLGYTKDDIAHLNRKIVVGVGRNKTVQENPNFKYKFEQNGQLTEKGLAFFITLFLEGNYAFQFLKQLSGFKDGRTRQTQATLEAYRRYSIHMPALRLESERDDNLILMDILNELNRCPKDLHDHLTKADLEGFIIKPSVENDPALIGENDTQVVLKRHNDRFTYFAMRYLDERQLLPNMRFMLDLGNYHFKVYEKTIASELRTRRLTQKLSTFGRIQDFSIEKVKAKYGDLVKTSTDIPEDYLYPYIVETNPHYHFFDDNIAVKFLYGNREQVYPDIHQDLNPASGKPNRAAMRPDIYISRDELMSIVLHSILVDAGKESPIRISETEKIISEHSKRIKQFFKAVSEGNMLPVSAEKTPNLNSRFAATEKDKNWEQELETRKTTLSNELKNRFNGLEISQIPDELKNYLLGLEITSHTDIAQQRLEQMLKSTDGKIRKINRETDPKERKNKIGKKGHREVKAGKLGDFIARDLMLFQPVIDPETGKGKATSLTFQVLQASIAFYGLKKHELGDLFKECQLLDAPNAHPFLHLLAYDKCRGIIDFYKKYLAARKIYIEKCLREKQYNTYHWLSNNKAEARADAQYAQKLARRYHDELPINLPRGLFLQPIRDWMLQNGNDNLRDCINQSPRTNTIYLLQQYFKHQLDDKVQEFYSYPRTYKVVDQYFARHQKSFAQVQEYGMTTSEAMGEQKHIEQWIAQLPTEDRSGINQRASKLAAWKERNYTEKQIRHQSAQDMVLFLMVKDLMLTTGDPKLWADNLSKMKLRDITPNNEKSILSMAIPFKLEQSYKEFINEEPTGRVISKIIQQDALKIKNYGDFRRFMKDRRLPNLMFYYTDDVVDRADLERELDAYDKARIDIFRSVLQFEEVLLALDPAAKNYKIGTTQEKEHGRLLLYIHDKYPQCQLSLENMELMKNIRNTFSHNQYPAATLFASKMTVHNGFIADFFRIFTESTYGAITQLLIKEHKTGI